MHAWKTLEMLKYVPSIKMGTTVSDQSLTDFHMIDRP
ncbi:predicted protein [Botrytis cinerea T4]|uniref:Uncharacterized protein n=1 Tax=Botryotinia fuckeliana (strain T4) TaxID=999810 RepID=G2YXP2_BOTF4|nr:predicted protein [Botrytis cinerea T4]